MLRPRLTEVRETFTRGGPWVWKTVNREISTWIFSWSSLNYRVDQKVTNLTYFQTPPGARKLSALTLERGRIL